MSVSLYVGCFFSVKRMEKLKYENAIETLKSKAGKIALSMVCVDIKTFNDVENVPLRLQQAKAKAKAMLSLQTFFAYIHIICSR